MFNPMAAIAVSHCRKYIPEKFTVLEMGNQRYGAKEMEPEVKKITGRDVNARSTREFYEQLGCISYVALDTNTEMDAVVFDLNQTQKEENWYDLVTNNGTGEHVFNQAAVFQNAHEFCLQGGVMLHILPFLPWVNHGFFNYNPILFRDLAAANEYEILFHWIGNRWSTRTDITGQDWPYKEKRPVELNQMVERLMGNGDLFNVVAYRKPHNKGFRYPIQGKYHTDSNITDINMRKKYGGAE